MAETRKKKIISNIKLGDMTAVFEQSEDTGKVGFYIMPAEPGGGKILPRQ